MNVYESNDFKKNLKELNDKEAKEMTIKSINNDLHNFYDCYIQEKFSEKELQNILDKTIYLFERLNLNCGQLRDIQYSKVYDNTLRYINGTLKNIDQIINYMFELYIRQYKKIYYNDKVLNKNLRDFKKDLINFNN